jgi:phytoene desaturase
LKAVVIGAGFSGLSCASYLAKAGVDVTIVEKHAMAGGRARQLRSDGFVFDMGPSWYWMPDVFERYFQSFGKTRSDYFSLKRLDPSYTVYWPDSITSIPAKYNLLKKVFEELEPSSGGKLDKYLEQAKFKYETGMHSLVYKPGKSLIEYFDLNFLKGVLKLDVFTSIQNHVKKFFSNPKIRMLLEFPVLFLGALPENTPALYSLMNYADICGGTWYPEKGMYSVIEAMVNLGEGAGVKIRLHEEVKKINFEGSTAKNLLTANREGKQCQHEFDVLIASADYHFVEQQLLPSQLRTYSKTYWDSRVMAPSCLLYYIGINKKLKNITHHSLFFDVNFKKHSDEIYKSKTWPEEPMFYVSATSVSDESSAPPGCENLFFLIPVTAGLTGDTSELREKYLDLIISRFEKRIGEDVKSAIIYKRCYGPSDFIKDYNAFRGNAYGLANTLRQTGVLKPACRSKKIKNLFYTGQLTVPGPGVPPSLISGEVVAREVIEQFGL